MVLYFSVSIGFYLSTKLYTYLFELSTNRLIRASEQQSEPSKRTGRILSIMPQILRQNYHFQNRQNY